MQINVSQLLKSNIGTVRNYEFDSSLEFEGEELVFHGKVTLMKTDRGILARGDFESSIDQTCSRCLTEFTYPLHFSIEEEYYPTTDIVTGGKLEVPDDPENPGSFTIDDHNILDLTEAVRQYIAIAVPIKPLCINNCAGLCPTCGANLNETTCSCPKQIDPRWAKLQELVSDEIE